ncbi:MAG: phospholipase [Planctomycetes bacterium]|nr:phospholipase [Planctomycetota bacterium]
MRIRTEMIGRLKCRIVEAPTLATPQIVVVLCHGFGASGGDLVPIGEELLDQFPELQTRVQFIFPEAPLSLDESGVPGGRAWWHIDMVKLQLAAATGRFRDLRQDRPNGLVESRELLLETVGLIRDTTSLPISSFVLGGFSQGAMLATDTVLQLDQNVAALVAMSGTLLNEQEWLERAPRHSGLNVLLSHGTADPLLPFSAAEWLRDLLVGGGAKVEFVPFSGGHQIPLEVFERLADRLLKLSGPNP